MPTLSYQGCDFDPQNYAWTEQAPVVPSMVNSSQREEDQILVVLEEGAVEVGEAPVGGVGDQAYLTVAGDGWVALII